MDLIFGTDGATWQIVIGGISCSRWCVHVYPRGAKEKHASASTWGGGRRYYCISRTYIDHEESLRLHSISNTFNGLFGGAMSMDWVQFCFREKGKWFGANISFELDGGIINCLFSG
jgi:hypothetical protein